MAATKLEKYVTGNYPLMRLSKEYNVPLEVTYTFADHVRKRILADGAESLDEIDLDALATPAVHEALPSFGLRAWFVGYVAQQAEHFLGVQGKIAKRLAVS